MKRFFSTLLSFALLLQVITPCVAADEVSTGYIYVRQYDSSDTVSYPVITQNDEIYVRADDIGKMTGYSYIVSDDKTFATFESDRGTYLTNVEISFDDYKAKAMGQYYDIDIASEDDETYYPLEKMLYLLHAQWCSEDKIIIVTPLHYSIIDFADDHVMELIEEAPTQEDLLVNGESQLSNSIKSVLASAVADFDARLFIPYWGSQDIMDDDYTEALQQLGIADEEFLDENGITEIESSLSELIDDATEFSNLVSEISGQAGDIEEAIDQISDYIAHSSHFKTNTWNKIDCLSIPELEDISDKFGNAGNIFSVIQIGMAVYQAENRTANWSNEFVDELRMLAAEDYSQYNGIGDRIIRICNELADQYDGKADSVEIGAEVAAMETMGFLIDKFAEMTAPGIILHALLLGNTVLEMEMPDYGNAVKAYDLCNMANSLMKIDNVAANVLSDEYQDMLRVIVGDDYTLDDYARLHRAIQLNLRICLRNAVYVYYLNTQLNNDKNWAESDEGQYWKSLIQNYYAMITEVELLSDYDQMLVLDSFDHMYSDEYGCVREKLSTDVIHETEEISEMIVYAMNNAATFAWSWFWDNNHYDFNDSLTENGITFYRINESNIRSEEDLETLSKKYFTSDITQQLVSYKGWIERNNSLYVSETDGLGGDFLNRCSVKIHKESATKYTIDVVEYSLYADNTSDILDSFTMNYELIDGEWVFDKELAWPQNILIEILDEGSGQ